MIRERIVSLALVAVSCAAVFAASESPADVAAPAVESSAPINAVPVAVRQDAALSETIILNFRDASLDSVLDYLSETAGFTVVKNIAVDGRVSIVSLRGMTPDEAVVLLNTVLKEKGYVALQTGRILKIIPLADAKTSNIPVRTGNDPSAIEPSDRLVTQVIPLSYVDAVRLKADIATLVPPYADLAANQSSNTLILTDTEANVRRMVEIVRALDTHMADVVDVKVFQLQYANAAGAARLIEEVFNQDSATTPQQQFRRAAEAMRRFRGPGAPGGDAGGGEGAALQQRVTASADDRTNTLVVSAPQDILKVIEGVVRELDANPTAEQDVFVYRLKNAKAASIEIVLNNLFSGGTTGRTQQTNSQGGAGQRNANNGNNARGNTGAVRNAAGTTRNNTPTFGNAANTTRGNAGGRGAASQLSAVNSDLIGQVYVVADIDTNSIMVMTASKNFDRVKEIIAYLDVAIPQVLIKVLIAEVTHTNAVDLGVEFSALNLRASGLGQEIFTDFNVADQSGGLIFKLVEEDVTAALRALEVVGKLDVLSRPYILASDNQPANITVGQEVPFVTNTRTTDTGQTINTLQYEDIGIILDVTPHINPEGLVILDVIPEISTLTGETVPISEVLSAPVFAKRSAFSRVAIRDGQTIVIGGLMEDRKTDAIRRVPILGSIPVLGALFRRTIKESTKSELLIFLTPHVALETTRLQEISDDEVDASEGVPDAIGPGAFQRHMDGMHRGNSRPHEQDPAGADGETVEVIPGA